MGRAKGVVDVDVRVARQRLRELGIVPLFLGVEAEVLKENAFAGLEALYGVLGAGAKGVTRYRNRHLEQLRESLGDGPQAHAVLDLAVGPAEVAGQNDDGTLSEQCLDRRQCGHDPAVVRDLAVLEGNVEVDADEDALACRVQVPDGELVHLDLELG